VVLVSCLPVVTLGFGAALTHLLRSPAPAAAVPAVPGAVPDIAAALNGHAAKATELFADDLARGQVPGIRAIRSGLSVGQG
jgi:hypothetical protein